MAENENNRSLWALNKSFPTIKVNQFGDPPPGILGTNSKPMRSTPTVHQVSGDPGMSTSRQALGNSNPNLTGSLKIPRTRGRSNTREAR